MFGFDIYMVTQGGLSFLRAAYVTHTHSDVVFALFPKG